MNATFSVCLLIGPQGHTLLARIDGADAPSLTNAIATHINPPSSVTPQSQTDRAPAAANGYGGEGDIQKRLASLMNQDKIVLFMKGNPAAPRCGFSRRMVALLKDQGVQQYATFDILEDEDVRSGLKVLNNWPTFPQLVVNGEFVGGLDVVQEMVENGEFQEILAS